MGVLSDLVPKAQPALAGGGCTGEATEGVTWLFPFTDLVDGNGDAVNLTGVTGTAVILDAVGGATVVELDFVGNVDGSFSLGADEADTVGLAAGVKTRRCFWSLTLGDGTDLVQAWSPGNSPFYIYPGA